MSFMTRWRESLYRSPLTWILAAMLALSIYSHWRAGKKFSSVCETILELSDGYYETEPADQLLATGIDDDAIMVDKKRVDALRQADSFEGRAYRWWEANVAHVVDACSDQLAEPYEDPNSE